MRSSSASTEGGARTPRGRGFVSRALAAAVLVASLACGTRSQGAALRIEAPEGDRDADVYVDGQYVGTVDALRQPELGSVALAPGTHRVEVRKEGRFPVQKTVIVDRDTPAEVVVEAVLLEDPGP